VAVTQVGPDAGDVHQREQLNAERQPPDGRREKRGLDQQIGAESMEGHDVAGIRADDFQRAVGA
jgi:hypothetical protein